MHCGAELGGRERYVMNLYSVSRRARSRRLTNQIVEIFDVMNLNLISEKKTIYFFRRCDAHGASVLS